MARTKTAERREAFLAAAKEVFQEMSFDRASMDAIAARAGSSKATLYRYFDSKEVLFKELVGKMANAIGGDGMAFLYRSIGMDTVEGQLPNKALDVASMLDLTQDVELTLREFGRNVLKTFHTPQRFAGTRMLVAAAVNPEVGRMFYEQGPVRVMKLTEDYFARAIEARQLRQADPAIVARHFRALLDAEVYEAGLFNVRTTLDDDYIAEVVERAVDVFLRAYRPVPGA